MARKGGSLATSNKQGKKAARDGPQQPGWPSISTECSGAGERVGQRGRGLSSAADGSHQPLSIETTFSDVWFRWPQAAAAGPQEPSTDDTSTDDTSSDDGAHKAAGTDPSGLWLQPVGGAAGPARTAAVVDRDAEDSVRERAGHARRPLAGAGENQP